jgi:hypothetical protein
MQLFAIADAVSMAIAFPLAGSSFGYGRLTADSGESIATSGYVSMAAAIGLMFLFMNWRVMGKRPVLRAISGVGAGSILMLTVVLTASRTAILALAGVLVVLYLREAMRISRTFVLVASVIIAGVVIISLTEESEIAASITSPLSSRIYDTVEDRTLSGRTNIYFGASPQIFLSGANSLIGVGAGGVELALGSDSELRTMNISTMSSDGRSRIYAHDTYIWLALALGSLGLAVGCVLSYAVVRRAFAMDRANGDWIRCGYVGFLALVGLGAVINEDSYWAVTGALLWVLVSGSVLEKESVREVRGPVRGVGRSARILNASREERLPLVKRFPGF